jgi:phosphohistidine phosphatase
MLVYLMRHGIAIDHDDPECPPEPERHLTPKGIEKTRAAAHGLRAMKVNPDLVLSSPYLRAMQTAEIACIALDIPVNRIKKTDALLSGASPLLLLDELSKSKAEEVICFGHAPHMDEFIALALHAPKACTQLKKAGVACVELHSVSPIDGELMWLIPARALRILDE